MGAHLGDGHVNASGCIVCPWHGLALADGLQQAPSRGQGSWSTFPAHDDGVLTWVQLDPTNDLATSEPIITKRPDSFIDAVMQRTAVCEPQDVIANRLDPWHGVHFHPYAFAHLEVVEQSDDAIDVNVGYRLAKRVILDVQARFDCPDANTIVMTITGGEGMGSVVETHATPVTYAVMSSPTRGPITLITEATFATSERHGFVHAKRGAVVMRPFMKLMAARLWRDDAKYAERLYELRSRAT